MDNIMDAKERLPSIDNRILDAVKRNRRYLGLTEWLEQYHRVAEKPVSRLSDEVAH